MWVRLTLLAVACLAAVISAEETTFYGHSVIRVVPKTMEHTKALRDLLEFNSTLDVWMEPSMPGHPVDVRVNPAERKELEQSFLKLGLQSEVFIADVQKTIMQQSIEIAQRRRASPRFGWKTYHRLEEINQWMSALTRQYPNKVSHITAGESFEGRKLRGVKIAFGDNKPIVFIEAGIHAREWVTPAATTYIINKILTDDDVNARKVYESFEWHVFPSTNPDGYEYTHTKNRMWRKTRSHPNSYCYGTDANRNWPHHWREAGSSSSPCDETYAGPTAASEKETQGLKAYLDAIVNRTVVYFSFHSYSQLLLFPWGYTSTHTPSHKELSEVAKIGADALRKRYNTNFVYGNIADTIYPAAGSTVDYAYSKGVRFPYAFELRDKGRFGFLLPPEQIILTGEETNDAVVAMLAAVKSKLNL